MNIMKKFIQQGINNYPNKQRINYIGYLTAPIGLGAGARNYLTALWDQGWHTINCVDATFTTGHKQTESLPHYALSSMKPADINIIHINAYDLPNVIEQLGEHYFKNSYNIGVWAWETEELPKDWHDRFDRLNEIWALSSFVTNCMAKFTVCPVLTIPYIIPTIKDHPNRQAFGLNTDDFIFLFNFDYESVQYRKNPQAAIEAFRLAFANANNRARLIIKTANHQYHSDVVSQLEYAAQGMPVTFINEILSTDKQHELIASCDAYISLHRAEGLGLGMAEAMSLGKPVIATGWSGNTDFMNITNSLLVNYELQPTKTPVSIYPLNTRWAEANVEHAATIMHNLYHYPEKYQALSEQAKKDIDSTMSTKVIGKIISDRLTLIHEKILQKKILRKPSPILSSAKDTWRFLLKITPQRSHNQLRRLANHIKNRLLSFEH